MSWWNWDVFLLVKQQFFSFDVSFLIFKIDFYLPGDVEKTETVVTHQQGSSWIFIIQTKNIFHLKMRWGCFHINTERWQYYQKVIFMKL